MWISLKALVSQKKLLFKPYIEDALAGLRWKESLKETIPSALPYTAFSQIKQNELHIGVYDALWISELEAQKHTLLQNINKKRTKPLRNIRFFLI